MLIWLLALSFAFLLMHFIHKKCFELCIASENFLAFLLQCRTYCTNTNSCHFALSLLFRGSMPFAMRNFLCTK
jgi:hypothetical protein